MPDVADEANARRDLVQRLSKARMLGRKAEVPQRHPEKLLA